MKKKTKKSKKEVKIMNAETTFIITQDANGQYVWTKTKRKHKGAL